MPSPSHERRAVDAFERVDGYAHLRNRLRDIAGERSDWAGIPMPLDGQQLIVEPTFPNAAGLAAIGAAELSDEDRAYDGWKVRNSWYSWSRRVDIVLMEDPDGRIHWGQHAAVHHITQDLNTLGCSDAWGLEQEQRALQLLAGLVSHRQMKHYVLTGMFLETSRRSGITYVFRRLKPTVALAAHPGLPERQGGARILAALCMHPIAYYAGSWAGAMCPTDDVVAHLSLMRGDEAMFWKRCNQHPPHRPEAGL